VARKIRQICVKTNDHSCEINGCNGGGGHRRIGVGHERRPKGGKPRVISGYSSEYRSAPTKAIRMEGARAAQGAKCKKRRGVFAGLSNARELENKPLLQGPPVGAISRGWKGSLVAKRKKTGLESRECDGPAQGGKL